MRLLRALARYLQFRLGPDPVDNTSRENADAVRFCGWFRFPCEEPPADFIGSVPTPRLTTFHDERR